MRRNPLSARVPFSRGPLTALLVASMLGLGACGGEDVGGAGAAGGPPGDMQLPVEAITVQPQPLSAGLETVGSLRADESVVVRPEVAGRIDRIHFTEGGRVEVGQPLFSLDASQAQASLNEASANLANSRSANERAERLAEQQLIARSDYDTTRAALSVDQARVASARTALSKMTLRAPFSGQIGLREVSVGEFVNVGQDLVTLVRLDPIEVDFSVPEGALPRLRQGQPVQVSVDAFPGQSFTGEIVAIAPVIDLNSRSAQLRAQVPNPDSKLRPGQFARLQVDTGRGSPEALMVPEQALMQEGESRFVYTVVDGKAHKAPVETGVRVPGAIEVVEGLKPGDVVITAGQGKPMMHEGMPVMVLPSPGDGEGRAGADAQPPAADAADATESTSQAR
ncbi:MAG: efflux RND transporter periplasmic adaptor subunit [Proteobacteria bacterium]|nr:efflux RND transporter periplasmic adaptor subunit [Pseudomonadota bacterium]